MRLLSLLLFHFVKSSNLDGCLRICSIMLSIAKEGFGLLVLINALQTTHSYYIKRFETLENVIHSVKHLSQHVCPQQLVEAKTMYSPHIGQNKGMLSFPFSFFSRTKYMNMIILFFFFLTKSLILISSDGSFEFSLKSDSCLFPLNARDLSFFACEGEEVVLLNKLY